MVALNDRLTNGSKCQTEDMMALNFGNEWRLWTPNCEQWLWTSRMSLWMPKRWQRMLDHDRMIALNAKLKRNGGSECQNKKGWWLWTLKLKMRLWTPNWKEMVVLNVELERNSDSECQTEDMVLNSKLWTMALNAWLQTTDSKCQIVERWWLWTPYCEEMMTTLNVELRKNDGFERQTENATLNVKMGMTALNTNCEWWL